MRKLLSVLALCLGIILVASGVLAQRRTPTPAQGTSSAQSTTTTQPSTSPASSTQGAFDKLAPGGQKITMALCNAQQGGCPPPQSFTQDPASPPQTTSTQPTTLTRDQIAAMKRIDPDWHDAHLPPFDARRLALLIRRHSLRHRLSRHW